MNVFERVFACEHIQSHTLLHGLLCLFKAELDDISTV